MPTVNFNLGGTLRFLVEEESAAGAFVTVRYRNFVVKARGMDMAYLLASGMQVDLSISYVDAGGNPAAVDGDVVWNTSDVSIIHVETRPNDSTQATLVASGPIGRAQVSATADADLGEGVRTLITTFDVEVVAGEAIAGTIEPVGAAEPIPPGKA